MSIGLSVLVGVAAWFFLRHGLFGLYVVNQNERAVKTSFGRAQRIEGKTTLNQPSAQHLRPEEHERYRYPCVCVIKPGGPYWKLPWQKVHKVSIATETVSMAVDPDDPKANQGGKVLEAVTKDHLNTGLRGQIRFRVAEDNLYAYLFGVKRPIAHVMGYFVSVLRQRVACFEAPKTPDGSPKDASNVAGVSINDLRKNMRDLNEHMDRECLSSAARYGIYLDASLITEIDPPTEVESALAAINAAHNHVSSEISLAQAGADQKIVQSRRAVEIETLRAQAEVEPLRALAQQLRALAAQGPGVLAAYVRNLRLGLYAKARAYYVEEK